MFHKYITAVIAATMSVMVAPQANAAMIKYSGNFTVDNAIGSFAPFVGQQGSFFFAIDYDAVDPEPTVLPGQIPGAVLTQGFSIGGESFVETAPVDLGILFEPGFLGLLSKSEGVSFGAVSDVDFTLLEDINVVDYFSNPLLANEGAEFNVLFGFVALRLGTFVNVILQSGSGDLLAGSGTIGAFANFDPQNPPDPNPETDPNPTVVPVPAALPLLISALGAIFLIARRRRLVA